MSFLLTEVKPNALPMQSEAQASGAIMNCDLESQLCVPSRHIKIPLQRLLS